MPPLFREESSSKVIRLRMNPHSTVSSLILSELLEGDAVLIVRLNRPSKRNALSQELILELLTVLADAELDHRVRAVVLTGVEGGPFSAGADIKELATLDTHGAFRGRYLENLCDSVQRMRKPLVAAVEQFALGGGFELALMCDVIIAGADAKLGLPEVSIGTIPGAGGTQRLVSIVGKFKAMKAILTAEPFTAQEAEGLGIISTVAPQGEALANALVMAKKIANLPAPAVQLSKESVLRAADAGIDLRYERNLYYISLGTADKSEGMAAFLEKRAPVWTHR